MANYRLRTAGPGTGCEHRVWQNEDGKWIWHCYQYATESTETQWREEPVRNKHHLQTLAAFEEACRLLERMCDPNLTRSLTPSERDVCYIGFDGRARNFLADHRQPEPAKPEADLAAADAIIRQVQAKTGLSDRKLYEVVEAMAEAIAAGRKPT